MRSFGTAASTASRLREAAAATVVAEVAAGSALQLLQLVIDVPVLGSPWAAVLPMDVVLRLLRAASRTLRPDHRTRHQTPHTRGTITMTQQRHTHARAHGRLLAAALALAVLVGLGAGVPAARAADPVRTHAQAADAALAEAAAFVGARQNARAIDSLATVRSHTRRANVDALGLIGAPPSDPESDDPPGPPAALAALKLDYRVTTGTVALLDGRSGRRLVTALRATVATAQNRRADLLAAVLALPEEGDGADYADGLADTLAMFGREVTVISTALDTFTLTPEATDGLQLALDRATTAQAQMERAFGGGE